MKRCCICDKPATDACGGCRDRFYCGSSCQKTDWITHHMECCDINVGITINKPTKSRRIEIPRHERKIVIGSKRHRKFSHVKIFVVYYTSKPEHPYATIGPDGVYFARLRGTHDDVLFTNQAEEFEEDVKRELRNIFHKKTERGIVDEISKATAEYNAMKKKRMRKVEPYPMFIPLEQSREVKKSYFDLRQEMPPREFDRDDLIAKSRRADDLSKRDIPINFREFIPKQVPDPSALLLMHDKEWKGAEGSQKFKDAIKEFVKTNEYKLLVDRELSKTEDWKRYASERETWKAQLDGMLVVPREYRTLDEHGLKYEAESRIKSIPFVADFRGVELLSNMLSVDVSPDRRLKYSIVNQTSYSSEKGAIFRLMFQISDGVIACMTKVSTNPDAGFYGYHGINDPQEYVLEVRIKQDREPRDWKHVLCIIRVKTHALYALSGSISDIDSILTMIKEFGRSPINVIKKSIPAIKCCCTCGTPLTKEILEKYGQGKNCRQKLEESTKHVSIPTTAPRISPIPAPSTTSSSLLLTGKILPEIVYESLRKGIADLHLHTEAYQYDMMLLGGKDRDSITELVKDYIEPSTQIIYIKPLSPSDAVFLVKKGIIAFASDLDYAKAAIYRVCIKYNSPKEFISDLRSETPKIPSGRYGTRKFTALETELLLRDTNLDAKNTIVNVTVEKDVPLAEVKKIKLSTNRVDIIEGEDCTLSSERNMLLKTIKKSKKHVSVSSTSSTTSTARISTPSSSTESIPLFPKTTEIPEIVNLRQEISKFMREDVRGEFKMMLLGGEERDSITELVKGFIEPSTQIIYIESINNQEQVTLIQRGIIIRAPDFDYAKVAIYRVCIKYNSPEEFILALHAENPKIPRGRYGTRKLTDLETDLLLNETGLDGEDTVVNVTVERDASYREIKEIRLSKDHVDIIEGDDCSLFQEHRALLDTIENESSEASN